MKPKIETTASDCETIAEAFRESKQLAIDNNCNVKLKFDGKTYIVEPKQKYFEFKFKYNL